MKQPFQSDHAHTMRLIFIFFVVTLFTACQNNGSITIRENEKDSADGMAGVDPDDAGMNAAIAAARKSYPSFLDTLNAGCADCYQFNVKVKMATYFDDEFEHVWLNDPFEQNGKMYGILANVPEHIHDVKLGDTVEIRTNSLSDWMYVQNGRLVGGFTIKYLYDNVSEEEKREIENGIGAKIR